MCQIDVRLWTVDTDSVCSPILRLSVPAMELMVRSCSLIIIYRHDRRSMTLVSSRPNLRGPVSSTILSRVSSC